MQPYIVLGHGTEKLMGTRPVVPPGCTLVLTEECGMTSVLPHSLYSVLADVDNTEKFADPVLHKAEVETLLKRPIRIYAAGESYPILSYTLVSYDHEYKTIGPSGLFAIPTPSFVFDATKQGEAQYLVTAQDAPRAFAGAVVPDAPPAAQQLRRLAQLPAVRKTQAELFVAKPGIHYSLLCRVIPEEDRIKELIQQSFPEVNLADIFTIHDYDTFQTAAHWIATLTPEDLKPKNKRLAVSQIQTILSDVMTRRRASGSPLGETTTQGIMTLLAMREPPPEALAQAIEDLRDIDRVDRRNGYTPLMLAARMGHMAAVHALLLRDANPNSRDLEGTTPLIFACSEGRLDICMELLAANADPRLASEDGTTALIVACSKKSLMELIPELIARGADPRVADDDGDTPLHIAASNGLHPILMNLVSAGGDPNRQNNDEKTPLMLAAEDGEEGAVAILIPITDVNIRTSKGITALAIAVAKAHEAIAIELVRAGTTVASWRKLHDIAVKKGLPQLAALVERRASSSNRRRTGRKSTEKLRVTHRASHH